MNPVLLKNGLTLLRIALEAAAKALGPLLVQAGLEEARTALRKRRGGSQSRHGHARRKGVRK